MWKYDWGWTHSDGLSAGGQRSLQHQHHCFHIRHTLWLATASLFLVYHWSWRRKGRCHAARWRTSWNEFRDTSQIKSMKWRSAAMTTAALTFVQRGRGSATLSWSQRVGRGIHRGWSSCTWGTVRDRMFEALKTLICLFRTHVSKWWLNTW